MSRSRENADGARLDAPLASPAFSGTPTGITAAHIEAGVLPSDVTGGSGLTAVGFPFTSGYQNIGVYRFLFGSGVSSTQESSYTNGAAGTNYYSGTGLVVSLSGFSSMIGAIGTMESDYVEVNVTLASITTSSVKIQVSSSRGNASWASPRVIHYIIWGVAS